MSCECTIIEKCKKCLEKDNRANANSWDRLAEAISETNDNMNRKK